MMKNERAQEPFVDLCEFTTVGMPARGSHLNVIKRMHIVQKGVQEVHRGEPDPDEPEIIVRRDHDTILSIEFLCKCGRSTSLRFEYEDE